jgi:hypothetical protein
MNKILEKEYCFDFDRIRQNMVQISYHKYGPAKKNFGEGRVDAVASLRKKLLAYESTGNIEYLADVANYAMFEFMFPAHPKAHYAPLDEDFKTRPVGTPVNMEGGEIR